MNIKGILSFGKTLFSRKPAVNTLAGITEAQWSKLSQSVFRQANEPKSAFLVQLDKLKNSGLDMPKDVQQALNTLERKATIFADRMDGAVARGTQPARKNYYEEFQRINSEQFELVENYIRELANSSCDIKNQSKIRSLLYHDSIFRPSTITGHHDIMYCGKIAQTDKNIFGSNPIFYHGTKHQISIAKNGFRTKARLFQRMFGSRELGDAVYLTPDKEVAAFYAGLRGGIIKTSVSKLNPASVNQRQFSDMVYNIAEKIGLTDNVEQIMKELFKRNGYNAAYSREGLSFGLFSEQIDPIIGKAQSQLAVYTPEDIKILPKTLAERIENTKLQFIAKNRKVKNTNAKIAEIYSEIRDINKSILSHLKKKYMPKLTIPKELRKQIVSKSDIKKLLKAEEMFDNEKITYKEYKAIRNKLFTGRIIKGSDWHTLEPTKYFSKEELNLYFKDGVDVNFS